MNDCELCMSPGGDIVWQDDFCRVVRIGGIEGERYPGFCRVIWRDHVKEMSDLTFAERQHLMKMVFSVELALRRLFQPDKMNLASLGNVTPHLHWHVIPRFIDDCNFPAPIWTEPHRARGTTRPGTTIGNQALHGAICLALSGDEGEVLA